MSDENKLSSNGPESGTISRRDFARNLAATALAAGAVSGTVASVAAAGDPKRDQAAAPQTPAAPAARDAGADDPLAPEEHLLAVIQYLYPDQELTPQRLDAIKGRLGSYLRRSQVLSSYPLSNSDEPTTVFAAYRGS